MCGITGIIHYQSGKNEQQAVEQSVASMQYRGPDHTAFYADHTASLGHVRLSIVDLNPRSHQPFHSSCGRYVMVFNGEIYNYKIIRNQMLGAGFSFRSESDTEVLLEGFIQYGADFLQRLRGMWAFLVWDKQEQKAFMARDRFGEKPFYYQWNKDRQRFAFASNLSALRPLVEAPLSINPDAVRQLLNYQYIVHDICIYKNIQKLPAAHHAWLEESKLDIAPYWHPDYRQKHGKSFAIMKEETRGLLISSIGDQLIADVPVGLFLSGGVDSGLIAGIAAGIKKDLMAVTMTLPGNEHYNEDNNASRVAKHCGLQHFKVPLDETCIRLLPKALAGIEPLADNSLIPSLFVAKYAGQHLRVMLSGDGADEFFGGYGLPLRYNGLTRKPNRFSDALIRRSLDNAWSPGYREIASRVNAARLARYARPETIYYHNYFPYDLQQKLFKRGAGSTNESLADFFTRSKSFTNNTPDAILWTGIQTRMTDDFLFKMDSANMLFSVESRAPFLDHRIAELTTGAHISDLMPDGIDKQILKEIGMEFIPREVLYDKKKGFAIPIADFLNRKWIRSIEQMADEKLSSAAGIFEPQGIHYIIKLYKGSNNQRLARLLYSILIFEIWLRVFHLQMDPDEVTGKYL